jgi:endonuclease G
MTPTSVIEATTARFTARAEHRHEIEAKLAAGSPLVADTPARVQKRIARLAASEMAKATPTISEASPGLPPATMAATVLERIIGTSDLMSVTFLELAVRVARTVGRVQIRSGAGQLRGYGTGFMVAPRLLITNNHVLGNVADARPSRVEFNFQDGLDGATPSSVVLNLDPDTFFATDPTLDYSVVAVRPSSGEALSSFGFTRLIEQEGKVLVGEYLNIIQHPNGEPKQLALRENRLIDILPQFLHYHTDTAPGSSGSPVFNDQWEVVGLHHSGVPKRDAQGRILTADGQVWTPAMGDHKIDWIANEGARVSQILAHVKAIAGLTTAARALRDSLFSASSAGTASPTIDEPERTARHAITSPAVTADGTATWTIPLQISIRLGGLSQSAGVLQDSTAQVPVTSPTPPAPPSPPGLDEALEDARVARSRTYYDRAADLAAAEAYYAAIDAQAVGATLFRQLSELLSSTHTPRPGYQPSRHVYPFVDLHPDLKIRSIYSQRTFEAEELIREDFRIAQERAVRLQERLATEGTFRTEQLLHEADLLEAALPFNCEHVVPQSWFRKKEPMKGDLHHLFACEVGCNSFRGNKPYFDFPDFEEAVRDECGKSEGQKFEPGAAKGAVARATLYFLLRYPAQVNAEMATYDRDRLVMLLGWHESHPVNEYERHRNMAIAEKQGNRNPLIDHPEWAAQVDFTAAL